VAADGERQASVGPEDAKEDRAAQALSQATADLLEALTNTLHGETSEDANPSRYDFREQMMQDRESQHERMPTPDQAPASGPDPAVSARLADMRELGAMRARQVQSGIAGGRPSEKQASPLPVDPWSDLPGTNAAADSFEPAADSVGFVAEGLLPGAAAAAAGSRVRWPWESAQGSLPDTSDPTVRASEESAEGVSASGVSAEDQPAPASITDVDDVPRQPDEDERDAAGAEAISAQRGEDADPAAFFSARLQDPDVLGWFTVQRDGRPGLNADRYDGSVHRTLAGLADGALRAATLVGLSTAGACTVQGPEGLISIRPVDAWFPGRSDYLVVFLQDTPQALARLDRALM
ncbi:MAG: hypothetical protein OWT27_05700, partial [Firmicutes bacterium]|nr:hypothetical protein [Bacillota bacterium]